MISQTFELQKFKPSVMLAPSIPFKRDTAIVMICITRIQLFFSFDPHCMFHEYMLDLSVRRFLQAELNLWIGSSLNLGLRIRAQLILCALSLVVLQQSNNNYY